MQADGLPPLEHGSSGVGVANGDVRGKPCVAGTAVQGPRAMAEGPVETRLRAPGHSALGVVLERTVDHQGCAAVDRAVAHERSRVPVHLAVRGEMTLQTAAAL